MGRIFESLQAYLLEDNWQFRAVRQTALFIDVEGKNGRLISLFQVNETSELFTFEVGYTFQVPQRRRTAVAELLTRANCAIDVGLLWMGFYDGEIGYRVGCDIYGSSLPPTLIRSVMERALATADQHLPAIAAACFFGLAPQAAYELLEHDASDCTIEQAINLAVKRLETDD